MHDRDPEAPLRLSAGAWFARQARTLLHDTRGGTAMVVAGAMPVLIGFAALAIDIGSVQLETRALQGIADAAAIAAAGEPGAAQTRAEAVVAQAGYRHPIGVTVTSGSFSRDATLAPAARFVAGGTPVDAVRVELSSSSPTFFAAAMGRGAVPVTRRATAARTNLASFSIGSRLASLDEGMVNAYLSALTGSSVSLRLMDYNALVGADVDLLTMLDALAVSGSLTALSHDQLLAHDFSGGAVIAAMAQSIGPGTAGTAATALTTLQAKAPARSIRLDRLIDLGALGPQSTGGGAMVKVDAMSLVTAVLQLSSGTRQVSFDMGATIPGLASTRVTLAVGERAADSPWIAVTDNGTPVIRTAQARLMIDTRIADVTLPGVGSLASVRVPLFVELASAEARLGGITCPTAADRRVTVEARTSPGRAAIASTGSSDLGDFTTAVTLSNARLVDTLLVDVDGRADIDLGAVEPWQAMQFNAADISSGAWRTVSSSTPVTGIAASLATRLALTVRVAGILPIPVAPIVQGVATQVQTVAPALDALIGIATGTLGVHYGEADVRVTGIRCGQPALVG